MPKEVRRDCGGGDCVGTRDANTILGSSAIDRIAGMEGNDSIDGQGGSDQIYGDEGNDTIFVVRGMALPLATPSIVGRAAMTKYSSIGASTRSQRTAR